MASESSTKQKLHSALDDMELISKELLEQLALPNSQRKSDAPEFTDLMDLLIEKDNEMKELLKTAEEQEKVQRVMDDLHGEVTKRDTEIRQLQRTLKEAEMVMATAVYQAKQKLGAIRKAQNSKVSSEDLIKYAHRISASNAVAAPPTWGPGDPRRPYPTDLEMRHSFLAMGSVPESASTPTSGSTLTRMYSQDGQSASHASAHHHPTSTSSTSSSSQQQPQQQQQGSGHHHHHHHHHHHDHQPQQQKGGPSLSWQSSQEGQGSVGSSSGPHGTATSDPKSHPKVDEEVELMSSDSSSSSSSDEWEESERK